MGRPASASPPPFDFVRLGPVELSILGQAAHYAEIVRLETSGGVTHTLRIQIKSDAYRAQCSATIERHDGDQWRGLYAIHAGAMSTRDGLADLLRHAADKDRAPAFEVDRGRLLERARQILG